MEGYEFGCEVVYDIEDPDGAKTYGITEFYQTFSEAQARVDELRNEWWATNISIYG